MPIIHAIRILYLELYRIGKKLPKSDKLGFHAKIESLCLEILSLAVEAAFASKLEKTKPLTFLRLKTEVLKHLWRTEHELSLTDEKTYLRIAEQIVEISKMANGWLSYVTQKEP